MSQKGVSDIVYRGTSSNGEECKLFDKLWGTLGNNVGIVFRSILNEAKANIGSGMFLDIRICSLFRICLGFENDSAMKAVAIMKMKRTCFIT
jgi:hypothetical protein